MPTDEDVIRSTQAWVERAVIGLNLCPFAARPARAGALHVHVSRAGELEGAVDSALEQVEALLARSRAERASALVVYPEALGEFEDYLEAAHIVEALLERAGCAGVLQVATFHPDYVFAESAPDDLGNFTNRAPYPIVHLLREEDVTEATERHPDPEQIPARNVARMEAMGREALEALWRTFAPAQGQDEDDEQEPHATS